MSIPLNLHPVLTDEMLQMTGYEVTPYSFEFTFENDIRSLKAQPPDGQEHRTDLLYLKDDSGLWAHDNHNIIVSRSISLNVPKFLFGASGIVCSDAELGLAVVWTSKSSNQTGTHQIGSFKASSGPVNIAYDCEFPKGILRGKVGLATVVYVKTPGTAKADEKHLANRSGMVLGVFDSVSLIIDGTGSVFPIVETYEPGKPLWWVNCSWLDPCVDSFDEENVRIYLNKAHKDFLTLKAAEGMKWSPMLKDVVASAMQIIIHKAQNSEYWDSILSGQEVEHGSIGHVIKYSISTFDWEVGSPENLARSIRQDLDKRIPTEMIS